MPENKAGYPAACRLAPHIGQVGFYPIASKKKLSRLDVIVPTQAREISTMRAYAPGLHCVWKDRTA